MTDDDGNRLGVGEPGTVWMKMGAGDFEYKGDKAKTNDSHDAEGYFTVGDIGYLNADGYLFLCDRKSDMIIAGGVNIYPAEIEGAIQEHPQVADVAVFGIPDDDMGEQIKAVVQPLPGVAGDEALRASIVEHIQQRLGKYKWPRSIDFVDELPAGAHRQVAQAQAARPLLGRSRPRDLTVLSCACEPHRSDAHRRI